jgi:hypothetical protein
MGALDLHWTKPANLGKLGTKRLPKSAIIGAINGQMVHTSESLITTEGCTVQLLVFYI